MKMFTGVMRVSPLISRITHQETTWRIWETVSDLAGNLTGVLIGLLALVAGGALAYRARRRRSVAAHTADPSAG